MAKPGDKAAAQKRHRKPNALKHGAFSGIEVFPWKDPAALERLHLALIEQYQPYGPLQHEAIQSIASLIWRKRRIRDKRVFDVRAAIDRTENNVLWEHPAPLMDTELDTIKYELADRSSAQRIRGRDEYGSLLSFSNSLYRDR